MIWITQHTIFFCDGLFWTFVFLLWRFVPMKHVLFFWWNKNKFFGVLPNQLCFIHVISRIYASCLAVRSRTAFIDSGKRFLSFIDHVSTNIWKMLGHKPHSFHRFRNKTNYCRFFKHFRWIYASFLEIYTNSKNPQIWEWLQWPCYWVDDHPLPPGNQWEFGAPAPKASQKAGLMTDGCPLLLGVFFSNITSRGIDDDDFINLFLCWYCGAFIAKPT